MKKILIILTIAAIMAAGIILTACTDKDINDDCLTYDMKLSLTENVITGEQTVRYKNIYVDGLGQTTFHLYANAYNEDAANPAYTTELSSYGGIEIDSVSVNGNPAEYVLSEDKEYMTVSHEALKKGDEISFVINYRTTVPEGNLRLSTLNGAYTLSGFYPQMSVYDGEGFRTDKFSAVGDPIYSSCGDYTVSFECDQSLVVCSSVKTSGVSTSGERQTISFSGNNIRDFAIVCNANYNVINGKAGEVAVYYFYENDENAQETLNLAVKAVETYGKAFGAYPFDTYTVARVPFVCDGMEYSGLSLIANNCVDVTETVLHETAHQWWYGAVGSDPINESYMDEGLATFSAAYYYELIGESDKFVEEMKSIKRAYLSYERLQQKRNSGICLAMNKPIYEFTEYQYQMVEYYKSCMMFDNLREIFGEEKFAECLKQYYEDNKFGIGGLEAFRAAGEKTMGDIKGLTEAWIGEKVVATTFAEEE